MKRIITSALLLLVLCVPAFTQNASDFVVDAYGVITKYTGFDTVVVIPAVIGGKKITAIGEEAFRKADITSVTIPGGITTIGNAAFEDNKLTSITISNNVTYIGNSAFANNRLTNVIIPNSVTYIGSRAFKDNKLTSITISGSVKEIGYHAFRGNTTLATIIIPEGVEEINSGAFADTKCMSVSLPSTIRYIDDDVFDKSGNPSFTLAANINVRFDSIPVFYSYIANDRKTGTYAYNLPLASKREDDYVYYETQYGAVITGYTGDSTRVRIPATIGGVAVKALYGVEDDDDDFYGAFQGKKLVAVQIPEGITYIGRNTFSENELANVTIPNSVTYLSGFRDNKLLTNVTIPKSVTSIEVFAFSGCTSLTSVIIPNSVTNIGSYAFRGCTNLTGVTIPNNVTSIEVFTFSGCTSLTSVTIPNSVTSIGKGAFGGCTKLTSVTFQGTILADNFGGHDSYYGWLSPFDNDLREKYLTGGRGTYTRPSSFYDSKWTKK